MDVNQFMAQERQRIQTEIDRLSHERAKLDEQIGEFERQLAAIDAYEKTLQGKPPPAPTTEKPRRRRRGKVREEVLNVIRNSNGMKRKDVLEAMGADDKKSQQSISNALANLKKVGDLHYEDGLYFVSDEAADETEEETDTPSTEGDTAAPQDTS